MQLKFQYFIPPSIQAANYKRNRISNKTDDEQFGSSVADAQEGMKMGLQNV